MVEQMVELRRGKMTADECRAALKKSNYFGTMLVKMGLVDSLLVGATYSTADTVRPALQLVKTKPGRHQVSSSVILTRGDELYVMGDGAINISYEDKLDKDGNVVLSASQQLAETVDEPTEEGGEPVVHPAGKTVNGQTIEFMAFPTDPEISQPRLQGDIWGFGVFDNGDQERIEAAKLLIRFFADGQGASAAVKAAGCFPVRDTVDGADLRNIWAGSDVMTEYAKLTDFLSGYDALTPGWATARTEWWNMLQRVGNGGDVVLETDTLVENANAAAKE